MVTEYNSTCTETEIVQHPAHPCVSPSSRLLEVIREKLGSIRYNLWFSQDTQCRITESGNRKTAEIFVRNDFEVTAIQRNCGKEIAQAVQEFFGQKIPFVLRVGEVKPLASEPKKPAVKPSVPKPVRILQPAELNLDLPKEPMRSGRKFASLDSFIVGQSNRLARSGADFAIQQPGQINPIFIFGPTSSGKTHLLEGIWTAVRRQQSLQRSKNLPLFMTAQQFITAFTERFQNGTSRENAASFRSRFKGISHLLIDDIQTFVRADVTQSELVQVIDMLKNQSVQLVFTGNAPAKAMRLRKDLVSRIEAGLACPVELPERELSLKICTSIVHERKLPLEPEVCRLIASRFGVHGRQITGAVNRLYVAYQNHAGSGKPITVDIAEELLSDLLRLNRRDVRLQDISKAVCDEFGIAEESLRSKTRVKQIACPRMLAMWLARKYTRSALSEIGQFFGNLSHSSVIAASRKMDRQITENTQIADSLKKIEHVLE
ncbi:MAG: hypothetical protein LBH00_00315 [Planctomycetaceae bacterium]|jgi:chromosomal replication initiator protein|nr:hypothetical protein [Planctomycetaceae bacterium]